MGDKQGTKKILSAGIGYILGGVLIKGIAFITTPIFSRLMSPEEFGAFNTYLSYESILAMLIGFQFAASLKNAKIKYADTPEGLNTFFSNLIALMLIHSVAALVFVNVFSSCLIHVTGISSTLLLNLLVINCFGNSAMTVYNAFVSLNYQYKKYVAVSIFNAVANVTISLLLIFTVMNGDKSTARILGYVIPYILISLYVIAVAFKKQKPCMRSINGYNRFAYSFCAPLIPNGFSEVMLTQYSKLSVEKNCGQGTMGVYSLAYNVYSIVATVKLGMDYIVGPFYFDKRSTGDFDELKKIFRVYSRFLALISVLIMLFSPEIVRILGDKAYYDARLCAVPLIAVGYFSFLCYMLSQEEYYSQMTYLVSCISIATMALNIALCAYFVPRFESLGAAFSTLVSFAVMFLLHFAVIKFILKSKAFGWRDLFIDSAFVTVMSVVAIIISDRALIRISAIIIVFSITGLYVYKNFKKITDLRKSK